MTERVANASCLTFAVGIGFTVSSGYPIGLVAAAAMPVACLLPKSRKWAAACAAGYYAASTWPIMPGLFRYFGVSGSLLSVVLIWIISSTLLSLPWAAAWTSRSRSQLSWRVPLAQIATVVPPLGVIGYASPLAGAGFLFPGAGWTGLLATAIVPSAFLALFASKLLYPAAALAALLSATCWSLDFTAAISPEGWEAVNTTFGDTSSPLQDYFAAQQIQNAAAVSSSRVIIFPETVVPRWTEATAEFWRETLERCRVRGQILAIGAGLPRRISTATPTKIDQLDLAAAIQTLKSALPALGRAPHADAAEEFDNTLMLLGAETGTLMQRTPVPIGMWQPFRKQGVPLHLEAPGVIAIDGQRAAVLICYEQLLPYPILASMLQKPTVLIAISNMHWFADTTLPRYQDSAMQAWAKLFHLPYLRAVNL